MNKEDCLPILNERIEKLKKLLDIKTKYNSIRT